MDRSEIESYRTIAALVEEFPAEKGAAPGDEEYGSESDNIEN